jgi:hypothetical protein
VEEKGQRDREHFGVVKVQRDQVHSAPVELCERTGGWR